MPEPLDHQLPAAGIDLAQIPTREDGGWEKAEGKDEVKRQRGRIVEQQRKLWAESRQSLLIVFQATDTGGKDSTTRRVFQGREPAGRARHRFWASHRGRARARLPLADAQGHPGGGQDRHLEPVPLRGRPRRTRTRPGTRSRPTANGTATSSWRGPWPTLEDMSPTWPVPDEDLDDIVIPE